MPRSKPVAYVLWALWLFGLCGIHRLYAGRIVTGILWFFTFGLCLVGQIVDVFLIGRMIDESSGPDPYRAQIDRAITVHRPSPPPQPAVPVARPPCEYCGAAPSASDRSCRRCGAKLSSAASL